MCGPGPGTRQWGAGSELRPLPRAPYPELFPLATLLLIIPRAGLGRVLNVARGSPAVEHAICHMSPQTAAFVGCFWGRAESREVVGLAGCCCGTERRWRDLTVWNGMKLALGEFLPIVCVGMKAQVHCGACPIPQRQRNVDWTTLPDFRGAGGAGAAGPGRGGRGATERSLLECAVFGR